MSAAAVSGLKGKSQREEFERIASCCRCSNSVRVTLRFSQWKIQDYAARLAETLDRDLTEIQHSADPANPTGLDRLLASLEQEEFDFVVVGSRIRSGRN